METSGLQLHLTAGCLQKSLPRQVFLLLPRSLLSGVAVAGGIQGPLGRAPELTHAGALS